ncbi:MAG: hypothetical protein ACLQQ4_10815 [Bacteroidia bacterium]
MRKYPCHHILRAYR